MTKEEEIYKQSVELFGAVDKQPKNFEGVFSKRQLNIAKEAEERYLSSPLHQYYSAEDLTKAFRDGAEWADMHPVNVWHDATEEPLLEDKKIILLNEQNIAYISVRFSGTFSYMFEDFYWGRYVDLLKINKWAYIDDLLPKQSRNSEQLKGEQYANNA